MVTWCFPLTPPHLALTSEEMVAPFTRQAPAAVCLECLARHFLCQAAPQPLFQWPALPQTETQGRARVLCECGWPAWCDVASGAVACVLCLACLLFYLLCLAHWLPLSCPQAGEFGPACNLVGEVVCPSLLTIPISVLWFFSVVATISTVTRLSFKKKMQLYLRSKKIVFHKIN